MTEITPCVPSFPCPLATWYSANPPGRKSPSIILSPNISNALEPATPSLIPSTNCFKSNPACLITLHSNQNTNCRRVEQPKITPSPRLSLPPSPPVPLEVSATFSPSISAGAAIPTCDAAVCLFFAAKHGLGVRAIALEVADAEAALICSSTEVSATRRRTTRP